MRFNIFFTVRLVQVHRQFKLIPETLHLTVVVLDRYLEETAKKKETMVTRGKFQLVGLACMFYAAKYQEIYAAKVSVCTIIKK